MVTHVSVRGDTRKAVEREHARTGCSHSMTHVTSAPLLTNMGGRFDLAPDFLSMELPREGLRRRGKVREKGREEREGEGRSERRGEEREGEASSVRCELEDAALLGDSVHVEDRGVVCAKDRLVLQQLDDGQLRLEAADRRARRRTCGGCFGERSSEKAREGSMEGEGRRLYGRRWKAAEGAHRAARARIPVGCLRRRCP